MFVYLIPLPGVYSLYPSLYAPLHSTSFTLSVSLPPSHKFMIQLPYACYPLLSLFSLTNSFCSSHPLVALSSLCERGERWYVTCCTFSSLSPPPPLSLLVFLSSPPPLIVHLLVNCRQFSCYSLFSLLLFHID